MKFVKNVPASVRQRLLDRARTDRRPFNELLQYYAIERFLYRFSLSAHLNRFVLKGALMLRVWDSPEIRPTMDIDMLGITSNKESEIIKQVRDSIAVDVEPDGLFFDPDSIKSERITEDADYEGIRIRFQGSLEKGIIHMQIDIGFGDAIHPGPEMHELPTLLDFPAPRLNCYSRESAIAEKLEAMVKLGVLNSRMKDFYDIWLLARIFDFDGAILTEAIRQTFERRGTQLPSEIAAFSDSFIDSKQGQWTTFWKRINQEHVPKKLRDIVIGIKEFLSPAISYFPFEKSNPGKWKAPGPWK
ncbi:MAG: nucleotidyl transferase AbiEii/AbiGii toxin family protein [Pseudomonadota bacterium]